ncbi:flavodoxin family protein [Cellulomonas endometrii]|uniref:flavodoxin family protein n=1 Tax=Cellulomonas endometrii TaxID=3036301 RepID=UPI0024ACB362|nr:flavodoxin domain-containing protein [Cellulomonas endometrii]
MTALVVYESMFGSTMAVAEAIAAGLRETLLVRTVEVGELASETGGMSVDPDVRLLVVGGPTHAFGMSTSATRASATRESRARLVSSQIGIREWLDGLRMPARPPLVAAFDTRIDRPGMTGSAARAAQHLLERYGSSSAVPARSFMVQGMSGGLVEGQLGEAREWGRTLAEAVMTRD